MFGHHHKTFQLVYLRTENQDAGTIYELTGRCAPKKFSTIELARNEKIMAAKVAVFDTVTLKIQFLLFDIEHLERYPQFR